MLRLSCAVGLALLAAGCDFPRDAGGTLSRVRSEGVLRAGYSERPPWVSTANGRPAGIEPRLIEEFASDLGARVEWIAGSESSLIEALHAGRIAVLVGGFVSNTSWASRAAVSHAYMDAKVVVTDPAPGSGRTLADLDGVVIAYRPARPDFAALIARQGARPQAREDWQAHVAVAYEFELAGKARRSEPLKNEKHVILVTQGESGFLYALDRFLMQSGRRAGANSS